MRALLLAALLAPLSLNTASAGEPLTEKISVSALLAPLSLNTALLGEKPEIFCAGIAPAQRLACIERVKAAATEIVGQPEIIEIAPLQRGAEDWPNRSRIGAVERLEVSLLMRRADRSLPKRVSLVRFEHRGRKGKEVCLFPLAHAQWSNEELPQRYAAAPRGLCGTRTLDFATLLAEDLQGKPGPNAIRFVSCEEAEIWRQRDVAGLARAGTWNPGHPFAKFFFLDSFAFWRGEGPQARTDYACALRIPALPLRRMRELSASGDAWFSVYDEGRQIELTSVTRTGLEALLSLPLEILDDVSPAGAASMQLKPRPRSQP